MKIPCQFNRSYLIVIAKSLCLSMDSSSGCFVSPSHLNSLTRIIHDSSIYLLILVNIKLCFFTRRNVCCSAACHINSFTIYARLVQQSRKLSTLYIRGFFSYFRKCHNDNFDILCIWEKINY